MKYGASQLAPLVARKIVAGFHPDRGVTAQEHVLTCVIVAAEVKEDAVLPTIYSVGRCELAVPSAPYSALQRDMRA